MKLPRKYQHLLELELKDVEVPDYFILTYAVCGCSREACGWGGWMIEAAFKRTEKKDWPTGTGDKLVNAFDLQLCQRCGRETFRTGASVIVENPRPFGDETAVGQGQSEAEGGTPMEYEDEQGDEQGKE